jgi:hypothetical protein
MLDRGVFLSAVEKIPEAARSAVQSVVSIFPVGINSIVLKLKFEIEQISAENRQLSLSLTDYQTELQSYRDWATRQSNSSN